MTDHNLFKEVDEDLERQKLQAFWKKYGFWILVAAVGIVASTASSTVYRSWRAERETAGTSSLILAIKDEADATKTIDALESYARTNSGKSLATLATLRAGAMAFNENDVEKAQKLFDSVANSTDADPAFRQLGILLSVQTQMDKASAQDLMARVQPLTAKAAPWRFSAMETLGYLALRAGEKDKAAALFAELSQDPTAPQSLAARAADILRIINEG